MKRVVWMMLGGAFCLGAVVDGRVVNQTTGAPQAGATVTLYKLGAAGMESVESVKSGAGGAFRIDRPVQGPHLIQTAYDGVTYNHMLPPGRPTGGLELTVYNSSGQLPPGAEVSTHMVLLEPEGGRLNVSESIVYTNGGKLAFNNPEEGTLRFFAASAEGRIAVRATAPQGMPVERAAQKTAAAGVYKVDFPIKPGETRFDINYTMPFTSPGVFAGRVLHKGGAVRVVAPSGVRFSGEGVAMLGQEPTTMATVYEVTKPEFTIQVEGAGMLSQRGGGDGEEEGGPGLQQIRPRVYDRFYAVLGLSLLILFFGFLLLLRRGSPHAAAGPAPPPKAAGKGPGKEKSRG